MEKLKLKIKKKNIDFSENFSLNTELLEDVTVKNKLRIQLINTREYDNYNTNTNIFISNKMSYLLIVESPGKIKKISEYLGSDYIVHASVGHIIDLDETDMSINLKTFEPIYKRYKNKEEVISNLIKKSFF